MTLDPEVKQKIQLVLVFALLVAGVRTAYILYRAACSGHRNRRLKPRLRSIPTTTSPPKSSTPTISNPPNSSTQQPVWVKEGYRYHLLSLQPCDPSCRLRALHRHTAPLQKLDIKDVVLDKAPDSGRRKQVMAIFEQDGKPLCLPDRTRATGGTTKYSPIDAFHRRSPRPLQTLAAR